MRIVFMGTPDFAVPSLQILLESGHEVCAVYTQPDKPKGRGYTLTPPPVKVLAQEHGIPVLQPQTLRTEEAYLSLKVYRPDIIIVVAYGKLLPKNILDLPPLGCVNVHGSLLPRYRGAAPIQWAVLNGDDVTGVTTMYMAEGLDTGDMILQKETPIGPDETAGQLFDRLSLMGAQLLKETLEQIENHTAPRIPQPAEGGSYASQLSKEMARIDWGREAAQVHNLVRGMNPWPVAQTTFRGKQLKVFRVSLRQGSAAPGTAWQENGEFLAACGGGVLCLEEVQYQGGKRMSGRDFLRGHALREAEQLGEA